MPRLRGGDFLNFLSKLKSRKFLCCVAGTSIGVLAMLYLDGTLTDLAGTLAAIASLVTYIRTEGEIDKASVSKK